MAELGGICPSPVRVSPVPKTPQRKDSGVNPGFKALDWSLESPSCLSGAGQPKSAVWVECPPLSGLTHLSRQPPYHFPLWLPPSLPHKVTLGEEKPLPPLLLSCHDQEPWTAFSLSFPLRGLRPLGRAQERIASRVADEDGGAELLPV